MKNSEMNWGTNDQNKYEKNFFRMIQIKRLTNKHSICQPTPTSENFKEDVIIQLTD